VYLAPLGRRVYWCTCVLSPGHEGKHIDTKRNISWDELVYWDEFERGPIKEKKRRGCRHCGKKICDCSFEKMAETNTGQTDFFRKRDQDDAFAEEQRQIDAFFEAYLAEHDNMYKGDW
jgi:hypothetical protein